MRLKEVLDTMSNSDRILIQQEGKEVFRGFLGNMSGYIRDSRQEVETLGIFTEVRKIEDKARWGLCTLSKPVSEDEKISEYRLADVTAYVYHLIRVKEQ